jgi:transposase-like protein
MRNLQSYTPEFRAEAIKLVFEQDLSLENASKRLGIGDSPTTPIFSKTKLADFIEEIGQ